METAIQRSFDDWGRSISVRWNLPKDERTGESRDYILAGPTCDSMDVLYEKNLVRLPADVREGDRLYLFTTGAYTQTYSAVFFNGFPPLKSYVLD